MEEEKSLYIPVRMTDLLKTAYSGYKTNQELEELAATDELAQQAAIDALILVVRSDKGDRSADFMQRYLAGDVDDVLRGEFRDLAPSTSTRWRVGMRIVNLAKGALKSMHPDHEPYPSYNADSTELLDIKFEETLHNTIVDLVQSGELDPPYAQALLLLFGQSRSTAPLNVQQNALVQARKKLRIDKSSASCFHDGRKKDTPRDPSLLVASMFIDTFLSLDTSDLPHHRYGTLPDLVDRAIHTYVETDAKDIPTLVDKYLAYGIAALYTRR